MISICPLIPNLDRSFSYSRSESDCAIGKFKTYYSDNPLSWSGSRRSSIKESGSHSNSGYSQSKSDTERHIY